MTLASLLRGTVAAVCAASLAAAPAVAEAPLRVQGDGPLVVRVGENKNLTHIEFHWAGPARMAARRDGQRLILSFNRGATPDLARLRVSPPQFLKTAEANRAGGGLQLVLTLADDGDAKVGYADGVGFVNLFKKADAPPPAPVSTPAPVRPNPVPDNGWVVAQARKSADQVALDFTWKAPLGAAAFRRGDAIWLVFDAKAGLDMRAAVKAAPQFKLKVVQAADFTAVRLAVPADVPYSVSGVGPTWTLVLGAGAQAVTSRVSLDRSDEDGPATLAAPMAGATRVLWLDDPVVGDRLAVITALAPAKGVYLKRDYVDLSALASAQGMAIQLAADDLSITTDGDIVRISRPEGLKLSPPVRQTMTAETDLPDPAAMPGLVDFDNWSKTGSDGFLPRYDSLMNAVATEANREAAGDKSAGTAARMGLARFLVGSELSYEAIGVLDMTAKSHPELLSNAEFRGLRGAAKVMAGRYKEAQTDFAAAQLADDPATALWRGYSDARLGQWTEARQEFQKGLKALNMVSPVWRARFARADGEAALRLNDFPTATRELTLALNQPQGPEDQLATALVVGRLLEAEGQGQQALPVFDAVARAPFDQLATPALLHATQIRLYAGKITPDKAAITFDSLRFRWRGDSTELEVIRDLGQLYLAQGRYREALEAMRSARQRMSDLPEALQIQDDLNGAFRNLFLNGQADGLEPVQALGLFYDFKELTPIGADGDDMVRKLAQRLVNVDLLDQAGELLKYQAENRLDGGARAQVATDLAVVRLMARDPEGAIDALNNSRTTLLPTALANQRRLIETRAWLQLGQTDHAAEILGTDKSPEGIALRAEVAWKRRDWPSAGSVFEQSLGDRWKDATQPLSAEEESKLLRSATAYSMVQDDGALGRLRQRWQPFVDRARWPEALRVALSGVDVEQITTANFAKAIGDDQTFAGWVAKMKQQFRDKPLGGTTPAPALRPMTTADAGPAAQPAPTAKG